MSAYVRCKVEYGILSPCEVLKELIAEWHSYSKCKGVIFVTLTNVKTNKPSRSYVSMRSGKYEKNGMIMNFCPICGVDIQPKDKGSES